MTSHTHTDTPAKVTRPPCRNAGDPPDAASLRLSRDEITAKLNRVPTFVVVQADGSVMSLPDTRKGSAEDDEVCTWFTDAAEAQHVFGRVRGANPDVASELSLRVMGLGDAFDICGGWPDTTRRQRDSATESALRLRATAAFLEPIEAQLIEALEREGLGAGDWRLPVFIGEELAQAAPLAMAAAGGGGDGAMTMLPVFFSPYELRDAYQARNVPAQAYAKGPKTMDLRSLVASMAAEPQEYPNPWRAVEFVASRAAAELAQELAQGEPAAAA